MRVVLDTNVLVSIVKRPEGDVMRVIYKAIKQDVVTIVFCKETYNELAEVLSSGKFRMVKRTVINHYLSFLSTKAYWHEPNRHGSEASDPTDQAFIDAAVATGCKYVVTGNLKHMPDSRVVEGVLILSPRDFAVMEKLI